MSPFENSLILTGPTACGKTALALELAERVGAEIVALDSMTVYRGMDVGTAKPTAAERARVPHHLIDVLDPWESLTVAWWLESATAACRDITARGKRPLFVGGTPFYLKALLHGLFPGPPGDEELRRSLEAEAEARGAAALHARLASVDLRTAARLHPNDLRRVVRALEVHALTGRPISEWQTTWDTPAFHAGATSAPQPINIPAVVLELPREALYARINERVGRMLAAGWLDEVRKLRELPRPLSREARQALGYRELLEYLSASESLTQQIPHPAALPLPFLAALRSLTRSPGGEAPPTSPPQSRGRGEERRPGWEETVELIRTRTRQFAKRQLTWFRHLPQLMRVAADSPDRVDRVLKAWRETSGGGEIDTVA